MYQPPIVTIKVFYPGALLEPSFLDVAVVSDSILNPAYPDPLGTYYDAWCLDRDVQIDLRLPSFSAGVYSSYEPAVLAANVPSFASNPYLGNLDNINWLLNWYDGTNPGITIGDVQGAIWKLMGSNPIASYLGPQDNIDALVALALANDGYVPDVGEAIGIILDPVYGGVHHQPLIIETRAAKLGDRVWHDLNANGIQDSGEEGIAGVAVQLVRDLNNDGDFDDANEVLADTSTDVNGNYSFKGLTPGLDYQVVFTMPNGYDAASPRQSDGNPASGTNSDGLTSDVVVLGAGEYNPTLDAGFYKKASLGDYVWVDTNNDGQQNDGNTGMNGVTVNLYTAAGAFVGSTTTANNPGNGNPGWYLFDNLMPGDYKVEFVKPAGYVFTGQNIGADASDSDADPTTGKTQVVTLGSGEHNPTLDAGVYAPVSIGDKVWEDKDADGQQENGEPGIDGVTVRLYNCVTNALVATTVTSGGGIYHFTGLPPGTYHVVFETPSGFVATTANVGGDASDSDAVNGVTGCYTLPSGTSNDTVDAGFWRPASLGDYVWVDTNNDGQQNDGNTGMNGVTVNLYTAAGAFVGSTTTANNPGNGNPGWYLFDNLMPGDYKVEFVKPAGYAFAKQDQGADGSDSDANATTGMTLATTLESGENDLSWDAGLVRLASLGDRLWVDTNGNGQQDDGATGIVGRTVTLIGGGADGLISTAGDNTTATTITGADGYYNFSGLNVGEQYQVQFGDIPAGYVFTGQNIGADASDSDADPTTGKTQVVTLGSGEHNPTLDAGVYAPVAIGDKVWEDKDADGQQENGEPGIDGVTVRLYNCVTNALVATTVTSGGGIYHFTGLPPGTYHVVFETPSGFVATTANVGGDASDSDAVNGVTGCYTLPSGTSNDTVDAGFWRPASLGDYVWLDANNDGQQNDGNVGVNGVTVNLYTAAGVFVASTVTADDGGGNPGWYLFDNLMPGDYKVEFVKPAGYAFAKQDQGADGSDSDANATTGMTVATTLESGENDLSWDAGLVRLASLGDRVWEDKDADGVQDNGEAGIANVTVRLYACLEGGGTGPLLKTTTTDGNGNYSFTGLEPGNYKVEFVSPAGYLLSTADIGNDDFDSDAGANGFTACYNLSPGENDTSVDAGLYRLANIGDRVWNDTNANGQQDNGENGIPGVTVELYKCVNNQPSGPVLDTRVTDPNGNYSFTGLVPGDYIVKFITPTGYTLTTSNVGADASDSDAGTGGLTGCYNLESGETDNTVDAGLVLLKPGIDIEKTTNGPTNSNPIAPDYDNEDAANGAGVPILTAGSTVTWTYKVTNTGNTNFAKADIAIVDDNGTPANAADDMSIANGKITYLSGDDGDNVLEAGESWLYKATGTVQSLGGLGAATTIDFSGSSATDGTDGNTRTYTAGGVTINVNAWSRDKGTDTWQKAWLGAYGGGLGVTDSSESGSGDTHTVDNNGRDNYIVFQFSQNVVVDKAFLGYVVGDSDMTVYVGSAAAPITTLNNAVLAGMSLKEFNDTSSTSTRWADFNAGDVQGNVLILAARDDGHSMDYFKVEQLVFQAVQSGGVYENKATVTAGGLSDSDMSHYIVQAPVEKASIGDRIWYDTNKNGIQDAGENGVAGVVVELRAANWSQGYGGAVLATTTTDANGYYKFSNLTPGDYQIDIVESTLPVGYGFTTPNQGADDNKDSDVAPVGNNPLSWGVMANTTLSAGENDLSWDAGIVSICVCAPVSFDFSGNTSTDGTNGNIRTFTSNGVSVNVSAFSRDSYGTWDKVYVGSYSGGLGVTDDSEGSGSGSSHTVDNSGEKNYLLFEFSTTVVIDKAYLGYVYNDSDMSVWIGNVSNAFTNHLTLSDSVLAGMGFTEVNTGGSSARWADLNANSYSGNVVIIAAKTNESNDYFKVQTIEACATTCADPVKAKVGDRVWEDKDHDGIQDASEPGIGGVKVMLQNSSGTTIATTTTDSNGYYQFGNLDAGTYRLVFDKSATVYQGIDMSNWYWAAKDVGSNDAVDADAYSTSDVATTAYFTLAAGQSDMTRDAGITPIVIDLNGDGVRTVARANSGGTFDLLGTGVGIHSGWLSGEDGFLAVDSNGNGQIDGIGELFGGSSKGDGFAKLASFDSNGDGVVDASDAGYASLKVWRDANGNHQTDAGELLSLAEAGVTSLAVSYIELPDLDANGNLHLERSSATLADGSVVDMTDVYFNVAAADAAAAGVALPSLAQLMGDGASLDGLLAGLGGGLSMAVSAASNADVYDSGAADAMKQMADLYDQAVAYA